MFSCNVLFEIAWAGSFVTTDITCKANTLVNKLDMSLQNSLLSCLVVTLITLMFHTGMDYLRMHVSLGLPLCYPDIHIDRSSA